MRIGFFAPWALALALLLPGGAAAQGKEVTFAHLDMPVPLRTVMESGELEKATGYKINWRMMGGGGDVIKAIVAGEVQIGEASSSSISAAASLNQEIRLFWILDEIADAEALIARKGSNINSVKDLKGKTVGAPFASTAHYHLLTVLKLESVEAKDVKIVNLRPREISLAWDRGEIDAAFIWDPVLSRLKTSGKTIISSSAIGKKGFPTFDGLVVHPKWAAENYTFLVSLVKALMKADDDYRKNQAKWTVQSEPVQAVARRTRFDAKDVAAVMKLYRFPNASEQVSAAWLGGGAAKAMAQTAAFLKEQGRIPEVKSDYRYYVTDVYVKRAMEP